MKQEIRIEFGHQDSVWSVCDSVDGRRVASASEDGTTRIRHPGSGRQLRSIPVPGGKVHAAACTQDGSQVFTANEDGTASLWTVDKGELVRTFKGHDACIYSVALSPDGSELVTASEDKTVRVWEASTPVQSQQWDLEELAENADRPHPPR